MANVLINAPKTVAKGESVGPEIFLLRSIHGMRWVEAMDLRSELIRIRDLLDV